MIYDQYEVRRVTARLAGSKKSTVPVRTSYMPPMTLSLPASTRRWRASAFLQDSVDDAENVSAIELIEANLPLRWRQGLPVCEAVRIDRLLNLGHDRVEVNTAGCIRHSLPSEECLHGHSHHIAIRVSEHKDQLGTRHGAGIFQAAQHADAHQISRSPVHRRYLPAPCRRSSPRACANWRR